MFCIFVIEEFDWFLRYEFKMGKLDFKGWMYYLIRVIFFVRWFYMFREYLKIKYVLFIIISYIYSRNGRCIIGKIKFWGLVG